VTEEKRSPTSSPSPPPSVPPPPEGLGGRQAPLSKVRLFVPAGCPWSLLGVVEKKTVKDFDKAAIYSCVLYPSPGSVVEGVIIEVPERALDDVRAPKHAKIVDFGDFVAIVVSRRFQKNFLEKALG